MYQAVGDLFHHEISIFGVIFDKYVLLIFSRNFLRFSRLDVVKKTLT